MIDLPYEVRYRSWTNDEDPTEQDKIKTIRFKDREGWISHYQLLRNRWRHNVVILEIIDHKYLDEQTKKLETIYKEAGERNPYPDTKNELVGSWS